MAWALAAFGKIEELSSTKMLADLAASGRLGTVDTSNRA
jgi:hypothetical protein